MKPTPISFPISTSPGQAPHEGAGRLINCFAEPRGDGSVVHHRSPGVSQYGAEVVQNWHFWGLGLIWYNAPELTVLPTGVFRGGIFVDNTLYVVLGNSLYTIILGGAFTKIGTVGGTDKVFFGRNNRAPVPDIALVANGTAYIVTTSSIAPYPDSDVGSPTCVVGHDGYLIFGYGNGDMLSTDINTHGSINSLTLGRAESNPDGVIQLVSYQGQLYVMGSATVEIWGYPVNDAPNFPLNRIGYNITPGLITAHAVTGFQPEFGQGLIYVASDHTVRWIADAATATPISTPDLDRLIRAAGSNLAVEVSNTNLEAMCYVSNGVPFVEISGPDWTWVFNCKNGQQGWHERQSYLMDKSRLTGSVFAFDRWLCGDIIRKRQNAGNLR